MYVVLYGNPFEGMSLVGPFMSIDDAQTYVFGEAGAWHIVKIEQPPEGCDSLYDKLNEVAEAIDDAANFLTEEQILPCETGNSIAERLAFHAMTCRHTIC
jgi:hypothetical protein